MKKKKDEDDVLSTLTTLSPSLLMRYSRGSTAAAVSVFHKASDRPTDRPTAQVTSLFFSSSEKEKSVHLSATLISTPNRTADHPSTYVSSNLASSVDDRSGPSGSAGGRDGTGQRERPTDRDRLRAKCHALAKCLLFTQLAHHHDCRLPSLTPQSLTHLTTSPTEENSLGDTAERRRCWQTKGTDGILL